MGLFKIQKVKIGGVYLKKSELILHAIGSASQTFLFPTGGGSGIRPRVLTSCISPTLTSFASLRHSNPFCGSFEEIVVFSNYFQWFSLAEGVGFEPTCDFHHA